MNLLTRIKEKRMKVQFAAQPLERSVLEAMLRYGAQITLPEPSGKLEIGLLECVQGRKKGEAPYYLQFFSDNSREGWLNAGYAAEQTAAYMKFCGIGAVVLKEVPEYLQQQKNGLACVAVLAFGCKAAGSKRGKGTSFQETSCIRVEPGEQWGEEVLGFVKRHGMTGTEFTHMVFRGGRIHFLLKASARKYPQQAAVDAGILIAGIMAAAEELWIDLEMVKQKEITEAGYLLSVCRKNERSEEVSEQVTVEEAEHQSGEHMIPSFGCVPSEVSSVYKEHMGIAGKEEPRIRYA